MLALLSLVQAIYINAGNLKLVRGEVRTKVTLLFFKCKMIYDGKAYIFLGKIENLTLTFLTELMPGLKGVDRNESQSPS